MSASAASLTEEHEAVTRRTTSDIQEAFDSAVKTSVPLNALFELTYRCNLACRHCYVADGGGVELGTAEVKTALDELAEAGTLFLTFSGGEFMLRKDWIEIARYAKKKHFALRLFTNGTLIDREAAKVVADLGVIEVSVSIYGATPAVHEHITSVPGSFDKLLSAMGYLREEGVPTSMKFLLMDHNVDEYAAVRKLAEEFGSRFTFSFQIGLRLDGSGDAQSYRLSEDHLKKVLADGFLYEDMPRIDPDERADLRGENLGELPMCGAGRDSCSVSPYGDVFPCATLPMVAGNLRRRSFPKLWRDSSVLRRLRGLRMADVKGCRECVSIGYCNRCPGFALVEDGDLLGPSSFACEVDKVGKNLPRGVS